MDTVAVVLLVGLAALYLGRRVFRTLRVGDEGSCGCASASSCPAASDLASRIHEDLSRGISASNGRQPS